MSNTVATSVRVGLVVAFGLLPIPELRAQPAPPPFTTQQCGKIRSNILGIFRRYEGRLSTELVDDLKEFSRRDCDRSVKLRMMAGTADSEAVSELKILIAARDL